MRAPGAVEEVRNTLDPLDMAEIHGGASGNPNIGITLTLWVSEKREALQLNTTLRIIHGDTGTRDWGQKKSRTSAPAQKMTGVKQEEERTPSSLIVSLVHPFETKN